MHQDVKPSSDNTIKQHVNIVTSTNSLYSDSVNAKLDSGTSKNIGIIFYWKVTIWFLIIVIIYIGIIRK